MKQLKHFALLGALLFSFIACNEEYEEHLNVTDNNTVARHFKIKKVDFNEISQNTALFKKLNKLNKGKKATTDGNGKLVFSAENDFYIDTDFATYIENENGGHSYTFLIKRDSADIKLENLILTSNDTTNYKMYIAQYDITDEEFAQLESGQNPDISSKTTLTPVNDIQLFNNLFSKVLIVNLGSGDCIIDVNFIGGANCPCNNHSYGQSCQCHTLPTPDQWIYTWGSCGGGGGPSGGDSTGSGDGIGTGNYGGSGGGSGGGNHNDEVDTTPVFELKLTPCEIIKDKTSTPEYKQKFKALNIPVNYNLPDESGFAQVGDTYVDGTPHPTKHTILFPDGSKNGTHIHNNLPKTDANTGNTFDGAVKMLSHGDIVQLIDFQVTNTDPTEAYVIMASNEGIFAITITQPLPIPFPIELAIFIGQGGKDFEKEEYDILTDCYDANNPVTCRKEKLQKHLLKALKDAGLDNYIALFEGEVENENDPNINNYNIKWTRKTIKKSFWGDTLQDAPCN